MNFYRRFPYTNLNDINLDWIIKKVKALIGVVDEKQDKPATTGTAGQVLGLDENLNPVWLDQTGGGGTTNYNNLANKPQIEGITLLGNKTAVELGIARASDVPTKTSDLTNDSGFVNASEAAAAAPVQSVNGLSGDVFIAIPSASSALPQMDGVASAGSNFSQFARADHVHPTDISRAAAAELATYIRPNLLDNWYFVGGGSQLGYGIFPINQREQTAYSNAGLTIDRWRTEGTLTVNSDGISTGDTVLYQRLCAAVAKKLRGKTVTASALLSDGTLLSGTATFPSSISATNVIAYPGTNNKLRYALVNDGSIQILRFHLASSDPAIMAAKVEIGSTQTLAHQENGAWVLNEIPNYAEQLAKCQAYYLHHVGYASVGFLADTGSAYVNIVTPSTMARIPTLEIVQLNNLIHGTTLEPITRAAISELRTNAVTVEVGVATTGVFELCMTADFMVNLSAE